LWTIVVVLMVLRLLGFITGYAMGGFVHRVLVMSIVLVLIRVIREEKSYRRWGCVTWAKIIYGKFPPDAVTTVARAAP
jgi:hypothetical protein